VIIIARICLKKFLCTETLFLNCKRILSLKISVLFVNLLNSFVQVKFFVLQADYCFMRYIIGIKQMILLHI